MTNSKRLSFFLMSSLFTSIAFGADGCLKKLTEEKIQREEYLKTSKKRHINKTIVAGVGGVAVGAAFAPAGLVIMGGMMVENTLQNIKDKKRANTYAILDVSSKIESGEKFSSDYYLSLGIFNDLKQDIQEKTKKLITDEILAKVIIEIDESSEAFCSKNQEDILQLNPMNKGLRKLIISEFSKREG